MIEVPFDVPDSWAWVRLSSICQPQGSHRPTGKLFRYIDIDSIDNVRCKIIEPKLLSTADAPSRARRAVAKGSVLFSMVRPYLRNIALAFDEHDGCVASTGFYVCTASSDSIDSEWLFLCMKSDYFVNAVNVHMRGDNSPSVRKDDMGEMLVPIPPRSEQNRIVREVARLFPLLQPN